MRSAGNLFGTTRNDQPGPFGAESGVRMARISGGVFSSLPGQNTQLPPTRADRLDRGSPTAAARARSR